MFLFALKMCVADLKRLLRQFWWITILFVLLIVISPFHKTENMYAYTYVAGMSIVLLIPRCAKIYFLAPLDEKQMKRLFLWRIAIVTGMAFFMALIFGLICLCLELPWEPRGLYWLFSYLAIYMVVSELGLEGLGVKKDSKITVRQVLAISVVIVCWLLGAATTYFSVKRVMIFSVAILCVATTYMLWYVKKIKMEDYTDVALSAWERGLRERD